MPTYMFTGSLTRTDVIFFIEAASPEEARQRAKVGRYDEYDDGQAEVCHVEIEAESLEEAEG